MIERFKELNKYEYRDIEKLLFGSGKYSFVMQEEIIKMLNRNVIKTTDKEELNCDISEAINSSMKTSKKMVSAMLHPIFHKDPRQVVRELPF